MFDHSKKIDKPWGWEWCRDLYEIKSKLLFIEPGHRLSLQYHIEKSETLSLIEGENVSLFLDDGALPHELRMETGKLHHIRNGIRHRVANHGAVTAIIFELSDGRDDDVVRLDDDYDRA